MEIDRGNEKHLISFLKPIQIPERMGTDPDFRDLNRVSWNLPKQNPMYSTRWPLLVNGLTVHVPPDGKPHSPKAEDLRSRMPDLETLTTETENG